MFLFYTQSVLKALNQSLAQLGELRKSIYNKEKKGYRITLYRKLDIHKEDGLSSKSIWYADKRISKLNLPNRFKSNHHSLSCALCP